MLWLAHEQDDIVPSAVQRGVFSKRRVSGIRWNRQPYPRYYEKEHQGSRDQFEGDRRTV